MFVLVTDYTVRKIMSANDQGTVAVTGRAYCILCLSPDMLYSSIKFSFTSRSYEITRKDRLYKNVQRMQQIKVVF